MIIRPETTKKSQLLWTPLFEGRNGGSPFINSPEVSPMHCWLHFFAVDQVAYIFRFACHRLLDAVDYTVVGAGN